MQAVQQCLTVFVLLLQTVVSLQSRVVVSLGLEDDIAVWIGAQSAYFAPCRDVAEQHATNFFHPIIEKQPQLQFRPVGLDYILEKFVSENQAPVLFRDVLI